MDSRNGSGNKKAELRGGKANTRRKNGKTGHEEKPSHSADPGKLRPFVILRKRIQTYAYLAKVSE